jgi:hypothetical protein
MSDSPFSSLFGVAVALFCQILGSRPYDDCHPATGIDETAQPYHPPCSPPGQISRSATAALPVIGLPGLRSGRVGISSDVIPLLERFSVADLSLSLHVP